MNQTNSYLVSNRSQIIHKSTGVLRAQTHTKRLLLAYQDITKLSKIPKVLQKWIKNYSPKQTLFISWQQGSMIGTLEKKNDGPVEVVNKTVCPAPSVTSTPSPTNLFIGSNRHLRRKNYQCCYLNPSSTRTLLLKQIIH